MNATDRKERLAQRQKATEEMLKKKINFWERWNFFSFYCGLCGTTIFGLVYLTMRFISYRNRSGAFGEFLKVAGVGGLSLCGIGIMLCIIALFISKSKNNFLGMKIIIAVNALFWLNVLRRHIF